MWTKESGTFFITDKQFEERFQGNTMDAVCIGNWRKITPKEIEMIKEDLLKEEEGEVV